MDSQTTMTIRPIEMVIVGNEDVADVECESMTVNVDPLACPLSASPPVLAHEIVQGESSVAPVGLEPASPAVSLVPGEDFVSAADSSPNISGWGRVGSKLHDVKDVDSEIVELGPRSKRVVGRRQAVVADDSDALSSVSEISANEDDSMTASSSKVLKKGVKRGRENEKDLD